ncbi:MAG TPA: protein kinase [Kofleriaceae bacterium]|jgi:serine/threonine-protein kinase
MDASHCPHDGTKLVRFKATTDQMIGKVLDGRYKIKKAIGEGGMGTVYSATQMSVDREVAIKVVHPSISTEREAAKRFLREARLASRLNAPNIVNVYDFGQSDENILYLVMEMVKGATLGGLLVAMGSLPPSRVVGIALQMCDALEAAHQVGIVHRDLKPGNIIIAEEMQGRDLVKVLDFGLAKSNTAEGSLAGITSTHSLLGTPLYMAPEMIEGSPVDSRTDLYALGCIMHELLVGTPPFNDNAISALFAKHLQEPPPPLPPNVPDALAQIIYRLMAKRPDDRVPDAQTLREALFTLAVDTPSSGTPILRSHRAGTPLPAATPRTDSSNPFAAPERASAHGTPSPDLPGARPYTPDPSHARPYVAAMPSSPTISPGDMMSPLVGMESGTHQAARTSAPQIPHAIPVTQRPRPQAPPSNKKVGWIIGGGAIVIGVIIGIVLAMGDAPTTPTAPPATTSTPAETSPQPQSTPPSTTAKPSTTAAPSPSASPTTPSPASTPTQTPVTPVTTTSQTKPETSATPPTAGPTASQTKTTAPTASQIKTATPPTTPQTKPATGPTTTPSGKPVIKKAPPKTSGGDLPFLSTSPPPPKK